MATRELMPQPQFYLTNGQVRLERNISQNSGQRQNIRKALEIK